MTNMEGEEKAVRIKRIREIVQDDFERISQANSPYVVLNISEAETREQVEERYERYERFYRAENFQRLGDIDLTRKALEIRRSIARAMSEIQSTMAKAPSERVERHDMNLFAAEEDNQAMGEIYFRDAMTYLHLGDHVEACTHLRKSVKYDKRRGIAQAYLGYVLYKVKSYDQEVVREAKGLLGRAAEIDPNDPDIFVLRGRFFAKIKDRVSLQKTIEHIENIDPTHPMLDRLQKKVHQLT